MNGDGVSKCAKCGIVIERTDGVRGYCSVCEDIIRSTANSAHFVEAQQEMLRTNGPDSLVKNADQTLQMFHEAIGAMSSEEKQQVRAALDAEQAERPASWASDRLELTQQDQWLLREMGIRADG